MIPAMRSARTALVLLSLGTLHCGGELAIPSGAGASGGSGGSGGSDGGGGIEIEGLEAPIQAVYDEHGIVHVTCQEDNDCYAALGYLHASNRFFFMDFIRNLVRGKLGSLVAAGDLVLEIDYENRRFFSTREGVPLEEKLKDDASPELQALFDAYTRGVNAWISDMRAGKNGATLTTEYDFDAIVKENIRDWEPEDSAAVGLYVLNDLSNNSESELALAEVIGAYDAALAPDLFTPKPVFAAFTIDPSDPPDPFPSGDSSAAASKATDPWFTPRHAALLPLLSQARRAMSRVGGGAKVAGDVGSNNWVVGPEKSASGNALLANDPHLALTNPSIWFAVELDAKSSGNGKYHVAGSTFPGLPSVMIGHNEKIAWGVTTAFYDLADVYVEELSPDGSAVIIDGQEEAIIEKDFEFLDAATGDTITKTFRWSPHGPIVSEDEAAGTAVAIRWRGHEGGTDLATFFGLGAAETFEDAKVAIENTTSASQNFVVIDVEGNFGWFPYIDVPSRPWASTILAPWLPLPGDGSAEWGASVPIEDLPQLDNPAKGYIATANQDFTGANLDGDILNDGPALQAWSKADGTRQQRILDELAASDAHTSDSMVALQGDNFSLYGERMKQQFIDAANSAPVPPEQQEIIDALVAWNNTCPTGTTGDPKAPEDDPAASAATESIGCTAFHAVFFAAVNAGIGDEIGASGVGYSAGYGPSLVARSLILPASIASGDLLWDDVNTDFTESRTVTLRQSLAMAATALAEFGDDPNDWRWGRHHTVTLRSIFDNFGFATYNEGPYAAPGALHTVNVANPSVVYPDAGDPYEFGFRAGPSIRCVVEAFPEGPRMLYQIPGGNDLHRESPFYNNLMPNWLANEPIAFPFGPDAVPEPEVVVTILPKPQ